MDSVKTFYQKNAKELAEPGNHIGVWEENGQIYMDVSRVAESTPKTIKEAQNAQQLAVYDLRENRSIPIGKMEKGRYTPLDEETNLFNQHRGQVRAASVAGSDGGVSKVSIRPRERLIIEPTGTNIDVERQSIIVKGLSKQQKGEFLTFRNKAQDVLPEFENSFNKQLSLKGVTSEFPAQLKSDARAIEKIYDDYTSSASLKDTKSIKGAKIDVTRIKDMIRGSYIVDNAEQLPKLMQQIHDNFDVIDIKNRFKKPISGYRDIQINVRMGNGVVGELQIQLPATANAKKSIHLYYEKQRELDGVLKDRGRLTSKEAQMYEKVSQKMLEAYEKAWQTDLKNYPDIMQYAEGI